eukprot:753523-Hanusia_phi.AAC.5
MRAGVAAVLLFLAPCCLPLPSAPSPQLSTSLRVGFLPPTSANSQLSLLPSGSLAMLRRPHSSSPALAFNVPPAEGYTTDEPFGPLSFQQAPGVEGTFSHFFLCDRCGFKTENETDMSSHTKSCKVPHPFDNISLSDSDQYDPLMDLNDPNGYRYCLSFASPSPIVQMLNGARRSLLGSGCHGRFYTCSLRRPSSPPTFSLEEGRRRRSRLQTWMPGALPGRRRRLSEVSMRSHGWTGLLLSVFGNSTSTQSNKNLSLKEAAQQTSTLPPGGLRSEPSPIMRESPQIIQKHGISGVLTYGGMKLAHCLALPHFFAQGQ